MSLQTNQLHKQFKKEFDGLCLKFDCKIKPIKSKIKVTFNGSDKLVIDPKKT